VKKALFVLNPASGRQNFWNEVEGIIGCLVLNGIINQVDVAYTKQRYDARAATASLRYGQYDFIVAVGGDGTVNDVVNGVIKSGSRIPLAVLSVGLENSFADSLRLPSGKEDFCQMIKAFKTVAVDIGRINGQYFINTVAGGIGTDLSYRADGETKAVLGRKAYFLEGLKTLPGQFFTSMDLYFDSEEFTGTRDTVMFSVNNSRPADCDGLMEVLIFEKMPMAQFVRAIWKSSRNNHDQAPHVRRFKTKKIKIHSINDIQAPVNADGEMFGTLPLELECVPEAVEVIVP